MKLTSPNGEPAEDAWFGALEYDEGDDEADAEEKDLALEEYD